MFVGKIAYNAVPTLSADVDITSKKYVDDADAVVTAAYIAADGVVTAAFQAADAAAKDYLYMAEQASDPDDPADGYGLIWMAEGSGTGDAGDIIAKSHDGSSVTYTILHDHSAGT